MNKSQNETFVSLFLLLRIAEGEGAVGHRDIVADVRKLDRRSVPLRIDRGPAVELEPGGAGGIAQERERQLAVGRILRPRDEDSGIAVGKHLRLAFEVWRAGEQRPKRGLVERPAALLPDLVVEEIKSLAVGDEQQVAAPILETDLAGLLQLQRAGRRAPPRVRLDKIGGHRVDRGDEGLELGEVRRFRGGRRCRYQQDRRKQGARELRRECHVEMLLDFAPETGGRPLNAYWTRRFRD